MVWILLPNIKKSKTFRNCKRERGEMVKTQTEYTHRQEEKKVHEIWSEEAEIQDFF